MFQENSGVEREPLPSIRASMEEKAAFFDAHPERLEEVPDEMVFSFCNNLLSYMPGGRYRPLAEDPRFANIQGKSFREQGEANPLCSDKKLRATWGELFAEADAAAREIGIDSAELKAFAEELNNEMKKPANERDEARIEEIQRELGNRAKQVFAALIQKGFRYYDFAQ